MRRLHNVLYVAMVLFCSTLLAACSYSNSITSPTEPATNTTTTNNGQTADTTTEPSPDQIDQNIANMLKDEKDYRWVIIIQDSSTINVAPGETTVTMDLKATNAAGGIIGKYVGTMTAKSVSVNPAYAATATSDLKTGNVNFSIGPVLAPLVPENTEDDRLAPLVPTDKDSLAPLVGPGNEPDYEGDGTVVLANPTGNVQIQGMGISTQKKHTSTANYPLYFTIQGTQVRMTMKTPQGDLYFDGFLRGEGK